MSELSQIKIKIDGDPTFYIINLPEEIPLDKMMRLRDDIIRIVQSAVTKARKNTQGNIREVITAALGL